jgi:hypothetical protein
MAIVSQKMGPGTLKLDTAGSLDVSCQVVSCVVSCEENVDTSDTVDFLCGEQLAGDESITYTWTLDATLLQDLTAGAFVAWSWTNKGLEKAFEFIPNTVAARKVTGTIVVVPIAIGGDSKKRNTSDVTWRGVTGSDFTFAAAS